MTGKVWARRGGGRSAEACMRYCCTVEDRRHYLVHNHNTSVHLEHRTYIEITKCIGIANAYANAGEGERDSQPNHVSQHIFDKHMPNGERALESG